MFPGFFVCKGRDCMAVTSNCILGLITFLHCKVSMKVKSACRRNYFHYQSEIFTQRLKHYG